ncbi:MBL fold metallo-hydrolase [Streptomyces sp. WMMC940]|uniref:MBL fold metallo-hydrolase n=1 Tax=Streptomyces sp. WMMC940 TaxID=3015153 RepID=UPI0022B5EBA8|nr:MBL fold metallo-hydrolase [Streptomyces sp. WMMC940]MCZ7459566.1 MBL fold metallo-hydrolase [Streptomyces sp. WMMC940]
MRSTSVPVPPERLTRPSAPRSLVLGEYRLTHIPDGRVQLRPSGWFPGLGTDALLGFEDHLDPDGCLVAGIGGLLVEYEDRAMLIDTGYGPRRLTASQTHPALGVLEGGSLAASLAEAGRDPASIDTVAFTHLHDDHVGWALSAGSEGPFFARASFVLGDTEWRDGGRSVLPAPLHGRVTPASDGDEIFPGVTLREAPGHTGGHARYVLAHPGAGAEHGSGGGGHGATGAASGGGRLLIAGDVLHSPLQVAHPEWRVFFDSDQESALRTRAEFLEDASAPDTLCYAGHFADVVFGRVRKERAGYSWVPLH